MKFKCNAISASMAVMLMVGSTTVAAAEEEYQIEYSGSVVSESCVISGGGENLAVNLEPVFAKTVENATDIVNTKYVNGVYSVICDGNLTATVGFGKSAQKELSAVGTHWGLIPSASSEGEAATGVLVGTYLWVKSDGVDKYPNLNSVPSAKVDLKENAEGHYVGDIGIRAGYLPQKVDDAQKGVAVTPGYVSATAPLVLTYQ